MRKIILSVLILTSILVVSCKKDTFEKLSDAETKDSVSVDSSRTKRVELLTWNHWTASFSATKSCFGDYYNCVVTVKNNTVNVTDKINYLLADANGKIIKNIETKTYNTGSGTITYTFKYNIANSGYYKIAIKVAYYNGSSNGWYPPNNVDYVYSNQLYLTETNPAPAPTNVKITYDLENEALLYSWSPVSDVTSYKIYNSWDGGVTYNHYITTSNTFYDKPGELKPNYYKNLRVKVSAAKSCGESSATVATRVIVGPRNVREYFDGDEEYTISWDAAYNHYQAPVLNYKLYASWDSGKTYSYYRTIPANQTSFTRELKYKYYITSRFKVSAVYDFGETEAILAPR